jgi:flagellar hook assembly protein FlgD
VTLVVFDALGREVRTLLTGTVDAGSHKLTWEGQDNAHRPLSSGVYFVRLQTVRGSQLVKTVLLK